MVGGRCSQSRLRGQRVLLHRAALQSAAPGGTWRVAEDRCSTRGPKPSLSGTNCFGAPCVSARTAPGRRVWEGDHPWIVGERNHGRSTRVRAVWRRRSGDVRDPARPRQTGFRPGRPAVSQRCPVEHRPGALLGRAAPPVAARRRPHQPQLRVGGLHAIAGDAGICSRPRRSVPKATRGSATRRAHRCASCATPFIAPRQSGWRDAGRLPSRPRSAYHLAPAWQAFRGVAAPPGS
jgi:hypothetical protein